MLNVESGANFPNVQHAAAVPGANIDRPILIQDFLTLPSSYLKSSIVVFQNGACFVSHGNAVGMEPREFLVQFARRLRNDFFDVIVFSSSIEVLHIQYAIYQLHIMVTEISGYVIEV